MTENGFFVLGGSETQLHDILWAVHDRKNHGRSEGEENIGEFLVTVGGQGQAMHGGIARFSRTCTRMGARHWALTEPERGIRLTEPERLHCWLHVTEPERSSDSFVRYCC